MNDRRRLKRPARHGSIGAAVACTASLGLVGLSFVGSPKAGAAHLSAGDAEVVDPTGGPLTSGGSSTDFQFKLPLGAACTGDSANGMYRIESYLVPQSVDLDTLKFDSSGPVPVAGEYRTVLYESDSNPYVSKLTAQAIPAPGPGVIIQPLPSFNFAVYPAGFLEPGDYSIGIACTLGPPSNPDQLDKLWATGLTLATDPADTGPAKIRFTITELGAPAIATTTTLAISPANGAAFGAEVTLTATVTPSGATGAVTFKDGTTTLGTSIPLVNGVAVVKKSDLAVGAHGFTAAFEPSGDFAASNASADAYTITGSSSSTSSTTSSTSSTSTTSTTAVSGGSSGGGTGGTAGSGVAATAARGELPKSGSTFLPLLTWAFLLVCFGRAAVLLGRRSPQPKR